MNKHIYYYLIAAALGLMSWSCSQFNDAADADEVDAVTASLNISFGNTNLTDASGLTVKFDNYSENLHYTKELTSDTCLMEGLVPGIYSITVSGSLTDTDGTEYYMNGGIVNAAIYPGNSSFDISVDGMKVSPLIFQEIYYCGSPKNYFRDQFYEIYNNSLHTIYLDSIYFAQLYPLTATQKLPTWPESDGDNYIYAARVWKFPGNGQDYPLKSGETVVLSQFAANHQLAIYNPNSPVDCSSSDFEFNMNNKNFPDQPATDMVHVFYNGKASMGSVPQFLTPVFGGAFAIFKVPAGDEWDPVNDTNMRTRDLSKSGTTLYAKIPISYVYDAVECGNNENSITGKRVPSVLDAGMTWVGATYIAKGVARRLARDTDGNYIYREDGSPVFQDTNNSTDDFLRLVTPALRVYRDDDGAVIDTTKMVPWNHTLQ